MLCPVWQPQLFPGAAAAPIDSVPAVITPSCAPSATSPATLPIAPLPTSFAVSLPNCAATPAYAEPPPPTADPATAPKLKLHPGLFPVKKFPTTCPRALAPADPMAAPIEFDAIGFGIKNPTKAPTPAPAIRPALRGCWRGRPAGWSWAPISRMFGRGSIWARGRCGIWVDGPSTRPSCRRW